MYTKTHRMRLILFVSLFFFILFFVFIYYLHNLDKSSIEKNTWFDLYRVDEEEFNYFQSSTDRVEGLAFNLWDYDDDILYRVKCSYNELVELREGNALLFFYCGWINITITPTNIYVNNASLDIDESNYISYLHDKYFYLGRYSINATINIPSNVKQGFIYYDNKYYLLNTPFMAILIGYNSPKINITFRPPMYYNVEEEKFYNSKFLLIAYMYVNNKLISMSKNDREFYIVPQIYENQTFTYMNIFSPVTSMYMWSPVLNYFTEENLKYIKEKDIDYFNSILALSEIKGGENVNLTIVFDVYVSSSLFEVKKYDWTVELLLGFPSIEVYVVE